MAHVAVLLAGLGALWLALAPDILSPAWLISGAAAAAVVGLAAWRLRLADREGAFYARAPGLLALLFAHLPAAFAAHAFLVRAAARPAAALHPALARLKLRGDSDVAAGALAGAIGRTPGVLAVEATAGSLLLHALVEDDADEAELREMEAAARRAVGAR